MRLASSAPSMERRGVVAPSDGLIPASVTMPHNNVRSDGLIPDVSQKLVESQDLPDEELRLLLNRARVSRWTDHIMELGAVCIEDVAMTSAEDLAPMPIIAAKRLIRFAAEASKEYATHDDRKLTEQEMRDADRTTTSEKRSDNVGHDETDEYELERARRAAEDASKTLIRSAAEASKEDATYDDLDRAEREMRDADRVAEEEKRSDNVGHDEADEDELERARFAAEDEAEDEGRGHSSNGHRYRSRHPFGAGSTIRRSADSRLSFDRNIRRSTDHPSERRHTRLSLGTDEEPDAMAEGDSPFAQIFNRILLNPQDPLHKRACHLRSLLHSLHLMSDVEESRMLKTAESIGRDKSIKSLARTEASTASTSLGDGTDKIAVDPDEISYFRVALSNAADQSNLP